MNNDVETNVSEEEIVLAPPVELFDEAKEIAQSTVGDEKFPFMLHYDANQKEHLLSMLGMVGAIVEDDDDDGHVLSTMMNMTQLAFIKRLDCIERVQTDEGEVRNPFLMEEAAQPAATATAVASAAPMEMGTVQTEPIMTPVANDGIAVASASAGARSACGSSSSCGCPTNTSMATAREINVESIVSGNICCPGAEQWFKFTVPQSKEYTIYTTGSLDTVGTLYDCCGNELATNDDYAGRVNFRIIRELTQNTVYYLTVKANKNATGGYDLKITQKRLPTKVTINMPTIVLAKDVLYELPTTPNYTYTGRNGAIPIEGLEVSIDPADAFQQIIWWHELSNRLTLDCGWDNGNLYALLRGTQDGIATLDAEDLGGFGRRDECTVYVGGAPVQGVKLDRTTKVMSIGDEEYLFETILPDNALNKNVVWTSDNEAVAWVDEEGVVMARTAGIANITVKTVEGSKTATCAVTVDPRPKVIIEEDDEGAYDFFKVTFPESEGGLVWKSIGADLSKLDDSIYLKHYSRFRDNNRQEFSNKQLAFLYRFDPLGVEHYVINHWLGKGLTNGQILAKKDEVYWEIFGTQDVRLKHYYFQIINGQIVYGDYVGYNREAVYSNAEVMFGMHLIPNYAAMTEIILRQIFSSIPGYSYIQLGVELVQALFFSGSIVDSCSTAATIYLDKYVENNPGTLLSNMMGWPKKLWDCWNTLVDAAVATFTPLNIGDLDIYKKIKEQSYRVEFENNNVKLSIEKIVECCVDN